MATVSYSMETDISSLEAPTFTTIDRGQPQAMLALDWDHPVNLVGKKVTVFHMSSSLSELWCCYITVDPETYSHKNGIRS
jgi:hypothetical protein